MPFLGALGIEKHQDPRWLFPRILLYTLSAFLMLLFSRLAMIDPVSATVASSLTLGTFWFICLRVNHRWVSLITVVMALILYYQYFPADKPVTPNAVLWILASAFAGLVGSRLTARRFPEDDQYFLPMAAVIVCFLVFWVLGSEFNLGLMRTSLTGYIDHSIEVLQEELNNPQMTRYLESETRDQLSGIIEQHNFLPIWQVAAFIWALGCWIFGGLARRLAAPVQAARTPLMLFQVQHKYIFLLILALILEISRYLWSGGLWPSYLAQPILAVLAVAFFMQAIGIVLFFSALQHSMGSPQRGIALSALGLVALALLPAAGALFGMLDVWFDFRKLAKVREQMEKQGLNDSPE